MTLLHLNIGKQFHLDGHGFAMVLLGVCLVGYRYRFGGLFLGVNVEWLGYRSWKLFEWLPRKPLRDGDEQETR